MLRALCLLCALLALAAQCRRTDLPWLHEERWRIQPYTPRDYPFEWTLVSDNNTAQAWQRCPEGLQHIVRRSAVMRRGQVIGCCPEGYTGYALRDRDAVLGCCPREQFPCFNFRNSRLDYPEWLGCADTAAQCCIDKICPVGYGCCRGPFCEQGVCRPHALDGLRSTAFDTETYCNRFNRTRRFFEVPPKSYFFNETRAPRRYRYPSCDPAIRPKDYPPNQVVYPLAPDLTLQRCANTSLPFEQQVMQLCHERDTCILDSGRRFVFALNSTLRRAIGCCPPNHTACVTSNNVTETLHNCANNLRNETCCTPYVCPAEYKCCTFEQTVSNGTLSVPFERICCPRQAQCCYGNPDGAVAGSGPLDSLERFRAYCGQTVDGRECAKDISESTNVHAMNRLYALFDSLPLS